LKKKLFALVTVAFLLTIAAPAVSHAQSAGTEIAVKVGFAFVVGEQTFPAGSYRITARSGSAAGLTIHATEGKENSVIPVVTRLARIRDGENGPAANLVFDKVGEQTFLSEVWMPGRDGYLVRGTTEEHQHAVVPAKP